MAPPWSRGSGYRFPRVQSNGDRYINSVLVNVLTKGQGGTILPMEDTNLQELDKIENVTNRE